MTKIFTTTVMTVADRDANKAYAAACSTCGGWHSQGGMSQYSTGPNGCTCRGGNQTDVIIRDAKDGEPEGTYNVKPLTQNAIDYFAFFGDGMESFNVNVDGFNHYVKDLPKQGLKVALALQIK